MSSPLSLSGSQASAQGQSLGPLRRSQRLLTALLGLLALVGVLTGVSLHRASQLSADVDEALSRLDEGGWPSVRAVHGLALLVDEARGMEALHLLLDSELERRDVEARLDRQRRRIAERLAAQAPRITDAAERRHLAEVNGAVSAWWSVQDQVLVASRAALTDAAQAQRARALMTGDSQVAYRRLLDALQAWWQHHDQQAQFPPSKARVNALQLLHLLNGLALLLGVAALALAGAAWRSLQEASAMAAAHAALPMALSTPDGDRHAERAAALLDELAQRPGPGPGPGSGPGPGTEVDPAVAPPRSKDLA